MPDDKNMVSLSADKTRSPRRLCDDNKIRDIFRYKFWDVEEAASFLVGLYETTSLDDDNDEFTLLDGRSLNDPEDSVEIEDVWERYSRLLMIWKRSGLKGKHRPATYIKMGFKYRDLCDMYWLGDVVQDGLLGCETEHLLPFVLGVVDNGPQVNKGADSSEVKREISYSQRQALLRMIRGLIAVNYGTADFARGVKEEIKRDLELRGFSFAPATFYKHLNAALEIEVPALGGVKSDESEHG